VSKNKVLNVHIDGQLVGTMAGTDDRRYAFVYALHSGHAEIRLVHAKHGLSHADENSVYGTSRECPADVPPCAL
jgi:hypothetical protein